MDLVAEEDREAILLDRKRLIAESCTSCGVENFQIYGTSIWDETLYKAWSEIVTNLIPNIRLLEAHLNNFCRMCDADEVELFERATFLVISHALTNSGDATGLSGQTQAVITDGTASSPPTDAVDVSTSDMASSPMSNDGSQVGATGGDGAPESEGGDGSEKPTAIVPVTNVVSQQQGAIEETPRHIGRTPHFDAHRFEKVC